VTGDLYRFRNNFHVSVFVVTPEGVIATDPIDAGAAAWPRDQIQDRFEQPIRYVIYSHDHADHISGCEVFEKAGAGIGALRGLTTDEHRGDVQPDRSAGRGN
jgi:glyoxylase-like metal-dependent hydrolase (beta-lactamase superfamily II)